MSTPGEFAVLAQGNSDAITDLRRALERRGIASELLAPPGGCNTGGCSPQLMLAVASVDVMHARHVLEEHWAADLSPEAYAASQRAIDLDAESAQCPACSTAFTPGSARCPGCGLRVG